MADRYEDRYRNYRDDRTYGRDERGFAERAGDEVRSWFGDDEARRRRRMDERGREPGRDYDREYDRNRERDYGREREIDRTSDHAWASRGDSRGTSDRAWGDDRPSRGSRWSGDDGRIEYESRQGGWQAQTGYGYGPGVWSSELSSGTGWSSNPGDRASSGRETGSWSPSRSFTGRGPKGYQRSDARVMEDVCDRLTDAYDIDASEIEVTVRGGEVTLAGRVPDRTQKRRSEDVIEQISGVREVHNNLRVAREGDMSTGVASGAGASPTVRK